MNMEMDRFSQLLRRSLGRIRQSHEEDFDVSDDFVEGFRQYRHSGHTHNRPIYSFKVLCLDGPYSSVTPRQARCLRAKNLGSKQIIISRDATFSMLHRQIQDNFPTLYGNTYKLKSALKENGNMLMDVQSTTIRGLKRELKRGALYVVPNQCLDVVTDHTVREDATLDAEPLVPREEPSEPISVQVTENSTTNEHELPDIHGPVIRERRPGYQQARANIAGAAADILEIGHDNTQNQLTPTRRRQRRNLSLTRGQNRNRRPRATHVPAGTPTVRMTRVLTQGILRKAYLNYKMAESKRTVTTGLKDNQENQPPTEKSNARFSIIHKCGDLFSCDSTDSLVHCVSKDLRMGKGIAVLFKQKFAGLSELKLQAKDVGEVAILKRERRFVYYLITKPQYFDKPTYSTLESSLMCMKTHCVDNNVRNLCMPRIGCGLDRLEWTKVEAILTKLFQDTDIQITVYML